MVLELALPAFIAGMVTFLAPCTLPLLPAYLAFISGVPAADIADPKKIARLRRRIFVNGLLYVAGFSAVFILLGSLVGLGGRVVAQYTDILTQVGGAFIILFGIFLLAGTRVSSLSFLGIEKRIPIFKYVTPGTPLAALIFGATFALGWTPCVGPILGSILVLAATSATVGQGAALLAIFSLGLALPFLVVALGISWAATHLAKISRGLHIASLIAGILLIFLGILMLTNTFGVFTGSVYRTFGFLNLQNRLLEFL
jgi:cytochrome c-type biogenesis protein